MRGTVLGFKDGNGVIQTGQGRVSFSGDDWMEHDPPGRGLVVDFEEGEGGEARQIFLALEQEPEVTASAPPGHAPRHANSAEIGEDIRNRLQAVSQRDDALGQIITRLRAAPEMGLALLLLITALFLPYASVGYDDNYLQGLGIAGLETEVTLVGLQGEIDTMDPTLDTIREEAAEQLDQADTLEETTRGRDANFLEGKRQLERIVGEIDRLQRIHAFAPAAWLIPLLGAAVIALGWLGYVWSRPAAILLGALACVSAYFLRLWEGQYISLITAQLESGDQLSASRRAAQKAFELEWGGWMLALLGVGCIVMALIGRSRAEEVWEEGYE